MTNFTGKQKEILEIAKEQGEITSENFQSVFSSPISRKANLERFMALGIIQNVEGKLILTDSGKKIVEGITV